MAGMSARLVIPAGQVFGWWTVVGGRSPSDTNNLLCRCACGRTRFVNFQSMRRGLSTSCGCRRHMPTVGVKAGDVFGRLTVLCDADGHKTPVSCLCKCGAECVVRVRALLAEDGSKVAARS